MWSEHYIPKIPQGIEKGSAISYNKEDTVDSIHCFLNRNVMVTADRCVS